jgi:hypothetical protein
MKRMGSFEKARPHVLGFGETSPEVLRPPLLCGICGAEAGEPHEVVSLGHEETLQLAASRKVEAEAAAPASPDVVEALYECLVALVGLAEGPGVTEFARGLKQAAAQHAISEARRVLAAQLS